jgi:dolichyl-phosphate beta-glucosyltransferase
MLKALQKKTDYLGFWDADLSTPLWEIERLISFMKFNSQIEVVLGARVQLLGRNIIRKTYRHYIGRLFATFFSIILKIQVYDTQCGSKIFRFTDKLYQIFTEPFLTRWLFDVEILARLIKNSGLQTRPDVFVREEPLLEWRHVGDSKIGVGNAFQVMAETWKLWKNYR